MFCVRKEGRNGVCVSTGGGVVLPMSPFSMALMSGLSRQSVGARSLSMSGSSSFSVMAKLVKLYIWTHGINIFVQ